MARTPAHELPSYRLHKPKGLAVVRLNGRDIYLAKYGTPESRQAYERVIAEWLVHGRQPPAPPPVPASARSNTVNELILAFVGFAKQYYVKNGEPTGELSNIKDALPPIRGTRRYYGNDADHFAIPVIPSTRAPRRGSWLATAPRPRLRPR
jgi:hypothetical protein